MVLASSIVQLGERKREVNLAPLNLYTEAEVRVEAKRGPEAEGGKRMKRINNFIESKITFGKGVIL